MTSNIIWYTIVSLTKPKQEGREGGRGMAKPLWVVANGSFRKVCVVSLVAVPLVISYSIVNRWCMVNSQYDRFTYFSSSLLPVLQHTTCPRTANHNVLRKDTNDIIIFKGCGPPSDPVWAIQRNMDTLWPCHIHPIYIYIHLHIYAKIISWPHTLISQSTIRNLSHRVQWIWQHTTQGAWWYS